MKRLISTLLPALMICGCGALCTSCGEKAGKAAPAAGEKQEAKAGDAKAEGKIAYVCIDTIINKYEFCTEHSKVLEKRMNSIQATLNAKAQALQNAAINFQKEMQNGTITSQEQAAKKQAALQKQNADLEKLQARYSQQFEKERQKYNDEMRDSIESFLKSYNKDGKYAMILSKVENNILYADKALDITDDVLNGLNARYKSAKDKKAAK